MIPSPAATPPFCPANALLLLAMGCHPLTCHTHQITIAYPDEGAWKRFHNAFKAEGFPEVGRRLGMAFCLVSRAAN